MQLGHIPLQGSRQKHTHMLYLIVFGSSALRVIEIAKTNRTEKAMKPELFFMYMVVNIG